MNKNIKFLLLLILVGIFAGFSGYLIKKNNVNDDLGKMNVSIIKLIRYLNQKS